MTTTIVAGRVLMEERRILTLDVPAILGEAQARAEQIVERLPYRLAPRWPVVT